MTLRTLIRRSLRFHWRAHLGVVLGAAIGSTALIGALVVGDSVKQSLRERALERLAGTSVALNSGDRLFVSDLIERLFTANSNRIVTIQQNLRSAKDRPSNELYWSSAKSSHLGCAVLALPASASRQDGAGRANQVTVFGVDANFLEMTSAGKFIPDLEAGDVWLNAALARQLDVAVGDEVILRIAKPSALGYDAAITPRGEASVVLRVRIRGILSPPAGSLSLHPGKNDAMNAFVSRALLEGVAGLDGESNLLLLRSAHRWRDMTWADNFRLDYHRWKLGRGPNPFLNPSWLTLGGQIGEPATPAESVELATRMLSEVWNLGDAQCYLAIALAAVPKVELRTPRVFLDPPLARAGIVAEANAQPILTYLVNLLRAATNTTPYSMVTAAGAPWTPADMRDDEILVSQWLADDLRVKPGDEMSLVYFDPESGARLVERTNSFRVRGIVPMEMPWADRMLMPDFPGIEKAESTSDWDAGFPLVHKIRQKDEDYWKQYRGTPKAFISLAAGQRMWSNRFGNLTAIRFPIPTNAVGTSPTSSQTYSANGDAVERVRGSIEAYRTALEKRILANLKPEELGLRFEPVREQALKAAEESQDFGGLFLSFSFFLIVAALLLMAMLFQFGLEQRTAEIGTLLALGFTPRQVRRLLLGEGVALAFIGGVVGALGGLGYARTMLHGLTTIWRGAVGVSALSFHATPQTLLIGLLAATVVGAITIWLALRKFVRRSARELLVGEVGAEESRGRNQKSKIITVGALLAAGAFAGWAVVTGDTGNAGAFFGAGALVLIAGLSFVSAWLVRRTGVPPVSDSPAPSDEDRRDACPTLSSLALNGCARRRTRSLATVAMLACGSFLIVSIGVFRLDANRDAWKRNSGTGGFALIGETTMPVVQDLNTEPGRDFFALSGRDVEGVNFVPCRVRQGDEASCLNLNRAQKPRLLGVKPELLEGRFSFASTIKGPPVNLKWNLLRSPPDEWKFDGEVPWVPAIGDANSVRWAMGKGLGQTIDFQDAQGRTFKVWIVGTLANSILQGQLLIDEAEFVKRFPGESGYRMFLIDAPSNRVAEVSATLSRAMQDVGLELTPAAQRLAHFNAVQNTYLGTFQVLGGLGLLLGSAGLGIVVLRNVMERRGELAVLLAVGFRQPTLQRLLLIENGALLALGLALGIVSAGVAVLPALLSPSAQLPVASLTLTLGAVLVNGALWTWAATRFALHGNLLAALRNE